jgi:uncharacterized protein YdeI (YjbR/CyaY-like superfamily)
MPSNPPLDLPIMLFRTPDEWIAWLDANSGSAKGVWLRLAKKASDLQSITYAEALDGALCYGWIDGQKRSYDADSWLQRFTPRGSRSIWSKINRDHIDRLIAAGRMQPAGMREVERARADGRWDAAYDSQSNATVPDDFQAALDTHPAAKAFWETLKGNNRYAILFRIHNAKKPETRAKRIREFVEMLARGEKLYP